jgi:cytochrome c peroxidase
LDSLFDPFDNGRGSPVPLPDPDFGNSRNERIRDAFAARLNASAAYVQRFGEVFGPTPITPLMFAQAIAEFEFTLVRADAPIDRYARGDRNAMSNGEKKGALLFFGKAKCVACHVVDGKSNEMFSDFENHNIGVPQIAPVFGLGKGDTIFDGPNADEDFGNEQVTGNSADRYKFRTSPLRNVALQPAFFHNGSFTRLEDAIRHHLEPAASGRSYDAKKAGVDKDLR